MSSKLQDATGAVATFAELIAPIAPSQFFAEYFGKKPLHIRGNDRKFADVMSWPQLNALLDMTGIWSSRSLVLVLDGEMVPAAQYCVPAPNRDGQQILQPIPDRVAELIRQGASILCNDIDTLVPGLGRLAGIVEAEIGAKVQSNLYCSWKEHRAFTTHFDMHEVFAVHVAGTKVWNIYQGRIEWPINHPAFRGWDRARLERARGPVMMEVTMEPGDLLYIPRGQLHDALAASDGTIHMTLATTLPIGLDIVTMLFEAAVGDPLFRQNLPPLGQTDEFGPLAAHVAQLAERLGEIARRPESIRHFAAFQRGYRYPRGQFRLPVRSRAGGGS